MDDGTTGSIGMVGSGDTNPSPSSRRRQGGSGGVSGGGSAGASSIAAAAAGLLKAQAHDDGVVGAEGSGREMDRTFDGEKGVDSSNSTSSSTSSSKEGYFLGLIARVGEEAAADEVMESLFDTVMMSGPSVPPTPATQAEPSSFYSSSYSSCMVSPASSRSGSFRSASASVADGQSAKLVNSLRFAVAELELENERLKDELHVLYGRYDEEKDLLKSQVQSLADEKDRLELQMQLMMEERSRTPTPNPQPTPPPPSPPEESEPAEEQKGPEPSDSASSPHSVATLQSLLVHTKLQLAEASGEVQSQAHELKRLHKMLADVKLELARQTTLAEDRYAEIQHLHQLRREALVASTPTPTPKKRLSLGGRRFRFFNSPRAQGSTDGS